MGVSKIVSLATFVTVGFLAPAQGQDAFELDIELYSDLTIVVVSVGFGPIDLAMFPDFSSDTNVPFECGGTISGEAGSKVLLWGVQGLFADANGEVEGWSVALGGCGPVEFRDVNTSVQIPNLFRDVRGIIVGYPPILQEGETPPDQVLYESDAATAVVSHTVFFHSPVLLDALLPENKTAGIESGVADSVVLDVVADSVLPNNARSRLLLFRFELTIPESGTDTVVLKNIDGLRGPGEPILNTVALNRGEGTLIVPVTRFASCEIHLESDSVQR